MTGSVERNSRVCADRWPSWCAACTPRAGEPSVDNARDRVRRSRSPPTSPARSGRRPAGACYRSHDGGHSWRLVPGTRRRDRRRVPRNPGRRRRRAPRRADRRLRRRVAARAAPVAASLVAVVSPYYRTNRLYAARRRRGGLWVSVRERAAGGRGCAPPGLPAGRGAIVGDPRRRPRPDVIYVACGAAGLWRSADFGATFQRIRGAPGTRPPWPRRPTTSACCSSPRRHGIELSTNARPARSAAWLARQGVSARSRSTCATDLAATRRAGRHAAALGRRRRTWDDA